MQVHQTESVYLLTVYRDNEAKRFAVILVIGYSNEDSVKADAIQIDSRDIIDTAKEIVSLRKQGYKEVKGTLVKTLEAIILQKLMEEIQKEL